MTIATLLYYLIYYMVDVYVIDIFDIDLALLGLEWYVHVLIDQCFGIAYLFCKM